MTPCLKNEWMDDSNWPKKQKHHSTALKLTKSGTSRRAQRAGDSTEIFSLMWTSSGNSFKQQSEHIKWGTNEARHSMGSYCCHSYVNRIHLKMKRSIALGVMELLNEHYFRLRGYTLNMHPSKSNQWLSYAKSRRAHPRAWGTIKFKQAVKPENWLGNR